MYTVETRELIYDYVIKKHLFICVERRFDNSTDATTFIEQFRERAKPGERAAAHKRIGNTNYQLLC